MNRSSDMKKTGDYSHTSHNPGIPGQSSPRPTVVPRINTAIHHTNVGFIGPQLPPHMAKVLYRRQLIVMYMTHKFYQATLNVCELQFLHRKLSTLMGMDLAESIPVTQSPAPAAVLRETLTMELPLHLFPTQSVGPQQSQTKINGRNFHSTLAMASTAACLLPPLP